MKDGRFVKRYFAPEEQAYLTEKNNAAPQSLAGLYAAKEAFLKALGAGLPGAPLADVAVLHTESGQPYYDLRGGAMELLKSRGGGRLLLTITHEGGIAAAMAVWEQREEG